MDVIKVAFLWDISQNLQTELLQTSKRIMPCK